MGKRSEATNDRYELKKISKDPSYKRVFGNYPAKKYKKGTPVMTRLSFEFTGPGTRFIDVASALSAINRRLYRQGLYYYVNSVEFYDNDNSVVDLHTIPDNWVTRSAWRRGKAIFDEINEKVLLNTPQILPKYHDFKVFMSDRHANTGTIGASSHDINSRHRLIEPEEWAYSQIVSADDDHDGEIEADNFYLHMLGSHNGSSDNWTSVGLIKSYQDTRPQPDDLQPEFISANALSTDPLINATDYSSEEQLNDVVQNLNDDNDEVPYERSLYLGVGGTGVDINGDNAEVVDMYHVVRLNTTEQTGRVALGNGFCAPCGLICVDPAESMSQSNRFRIVLNMALGTYHGVYAERM